MAFTYTSNGYNVTGAKARETGTFTNASDSTGGTIKTMLGKIDFVSTTPAATSISVSGNEVTIVTASNAGGYWAVEGV